jgi:hypothetical protein
MSAFYDRLCQVILGFLPPPKPEMPDDPERVARVGRWLTVLKPLIRSLEATSPSPNAELNQATVSGFLTIALALEGDDQLTIAVVPPSEVVHLPCRRRGYNLLLDDLISDPAEDLCEELDAQIGGESLLNLIKEVWEIVGEPIAGRLYDGFPDFAAHVSPTVVQDAFYGYYRIILIFVMAVLLDDRATVDEMAPLMRQLPMGLPLGSAVDDPQRWYVLLPGEAVGNAADKYDGGDDDDDDDGDGTD